MKPEAPTDEVQFCILEHSYHTYLPIGNLDAMYAEINLIALPPSLRQTIRARQRQNGKAPKQSLDNHHAATSIDTSGLDASPSDSLAGAEATAPNICQIDDPQPSGMVQTDSPRAGAITVAKTFIDARWRRIVYKVDWENCGLIWILVTIGAVIVGTVTHNGVISIIGFLGFGIPLLVYLIFLGQLLLRSILLLCTPDEWPMTGGGLVRTRLEFVVHALPAFWPFVLIGYIIWSSHGHKK